MKAGRAFSVGGNGRNASCLRPGMHRPVRSSGGGATVTNGRAFQKVPSHPVRKHYVSITLNATTTTISTTAVIPIILKLLPLFDFERTK